MNVTIFGDSYSAGENNHGISYANYLRQEKNIHVRNLAISGSTMGEYSIFPTDGNSLLSMIKNNIVAVKEADVIILQYGLNDAVACAAGNTNLSTVLISFIKALDLIKQINANCKVLFLAVAPPKSLLAECLAENIHEYLANVYLKDFSFFHYIEALDIFDYYNNIVSNICRGACYFYEYMFDTNFRGRDLISDDGIHPSDDGHRCISESLIDALNLIDALKTITNF